MVIGYFVVSAEPTVHIFNKQVERVSSGAIPLRAMRISLAIGVSASLGLSALRVIIGVNIYWFLVPAYLAAFTLTFIAPKFFTSIAFDSGFVVTGPVSVTLLLPYTVGICQAVGGNIMTDALGTVAMVVVMPNITIQIVGIIYEKMMKKAAAANDEYTSGDTNVVDYVHSCGEV
jgi:hypothetical protein